MNANIESNPLIDRLPKHLKQFIKPQDYDDYTPINQALTTSAGLPTALTSKVSKRPVSRSTASRACMA